MWEEWSNYGSEISSKANPIGQMNFSSTSINGSPPNLPHSTILYLAGWSTNSWKKCSIYCQEDSNKWAFISSSQISTSCSYLLASTPPTKPEILSITPCGSVFRIIRNFSDILDWRLVKICIKFWFSKTNSISWACLTTKNITTNFKLSIWCLLKTQNTSNFYLQTSLKKWQDYKMSLASNSVIIRCNFSLISINFYMIRSLNTFKKISSICWSTL